MMLVMMMAMIAAPNPASIDAPRRNFAACIRQFESQSRMDKVAPAAYAAAARAACPAEAAALIKALVAYDVAMGTKRASAEANAKNDVADYVTTSDERYRDTVAPQ
jgi:hypothetical protein